MALGTMIVASFSVTAQDRFADATVGSEKITDSIYMLTGPGGNIGVTTGEDGMLIIDDKYAPLSEKILAALKAIDDQPLHYVINTHYHGDHTGSNAQMHAHGATIFAHHNVRMRLQNDDKLSADALPVVTYADGIKVHFNGDTLDIRHLPTGHTDGDSWIMFENANVIHTGDLFFRDRFPYIDLKAGGTVDGYIANVETILAAIDDSTVVIPGHGDIAKKADLQRFVDMIKATSKDVTERKQAGASVEQIIEEGLDEQWQDWSWQFINEERWIKTLY